VDKSKAVKVLVDNICIRLSLFAKQIEKVTSDPNLKIIGFHEWLLFLIHHIDYLAFSKGLEENQRYLVREEIFRNLLERDILPPKVESEMIDRGEKPSIRSLGGDNPVIIFSLMKSFRQEANERDEYYSTCTTLVGKYPLDERGFVNKLINNIVMSSGCGRNFLNEILITDIAVSLLLNKKLAKEDMKALDTFKD
jgi:hypothetical protein